MRVISCYFAFRRGPLEMFLRGTRECPMRRILETDSKSFLYNTSLKLVLKHLKSISSFWKLKYWRNGELKSILSHVHRGPLRIDFK